ncbi:uncharacterized protein N7479_003069 [Penicillium vulpinum]|uniref:DUF202 domain-containing protein n=1 Tax=Penicillium vulpinum TaxID=29845 RepID=A0A1V6R037_9EURO|nr:uncharacterized protein N7479_003069 [Penicillium vulpinum]KAJ5973151.1 hypothetical protein N7479_003069 [Penicillium vulpinum]OQD94803.1 hypothetical protein PENVUL_c130G01284 [Penicillium vulpinum]
MNRQLFRRLWPQPVANNRSELRDHQANERTFLSWNRFGLAFAAMSLALTRLDIIDNIFNRKHRDETAVASIASLETNSEGKLPSRQTQNKSILLEYANDHVASRVCQAISIWSFGYSLARYTSTRRNLLLGRYVPSIWGPVIVTLGSLGVFGMTLKLG